MGKDSDSEKKLTTFAEEWKKLGSQFRPEDFVSKPEPCEPESAYLPVPTVPVALMDVKEAKKVQAALSACTGIVGNWGDLPSKKDTPKFAQAAAVFRSLTGVDVWEVLMLARQQMLRTPL